MPLITNSVIKSQATPLSKFVNGSNACKMLGFFALFLSLQLFRQCSVESNTQVNVLLQFPEISHVVLPLLYFWRAPQLILVPFTLKLNLSGFFI